MKSILLTTAAALGFSALAAQAQMTDPEETTPRRAETAMSMRADRADFGGDGYTSTDGEVLYGTLCAGCHMPDGRGAVGAGFYPALAGNENLEYSGYAIYIIVNGQGGMPSLGHFLDDEQVVAVTSYIQSELGNGYEPDATVEAVADSRPVDPADQNTKEHE
ncbi:c-type cytochrome [Jannaschia rubra]|uniref:c-type cytochrome n=1 Tax=Jannaschia rubra TaxID=282197 RepID=UPI00248FD506|nr:cytochrome c [Jannaschia rubra]